MFTEDKMRCVKLCVDFMLENKNIFRVFKLSGDETLMKNILEKHIGLESQVEIKGRAFNEINFDLLESNKTICKSVLFEYWDKIEPFDNFVAKINNFFD